MAPPVALVTGASSGIGLALTKHLLSRGWHVILGDVNPPREDLPSEQTLFVAADISSWDEQSALFEKGYAWRGRLDFCALNAGMDDRDDIFHSIAAQSAEAEEQGKLPPPPKKPNTKIFDVNLTGTYYGIKLAAHYLSLPSESAGKSKPGGKIVITASAAGLYPALPFIPQYVATKSGLIGLVHSLGPVAKAANICIGALCPQFVVTGLAPPSLLKSAKKEHITPMSTIMRCFDELADLDHVSDVGWVEGGKSGQVLEGNLEKLIYHDPPMPEMPEDATLPDLEAWENAYVGRNKQFVREG